MLQMKWGRGRAKGGPNLIGKRMNAECVIWKGPKNNVIVNVRKQKLGGDTLVFVSTHTVKEVDSLEENCFFCLDKGRSCVWLAE